MKHSSFLTWPVVVMFTRQGREGPNYGGRGLVCGTQECPAGTSDVELRRKFWAKCEEGRVPGILVQLKP